MMEHEIGYAELIEKLRKGPLIDKVEAAETLGKLNFTEAVEILVTTLSHSRDWRLRESIVYALGKLAGEEALDPLLKLLNTRNSSFRWWVVESIGLISNRTGDKRAIVPFITLLKKDSDPDVRYHIAFALGEFGDPQALSALDYCYNYDKGRKEKGGQMEVRSAALEAIEKITGATDE